MKYFFYEIKKQRKLMLLILLLYTFFMFISEVLWGITVAFELYVNAVMALYYGSILSNEDEIEIIKSSETSLKRVFFSRLAASYIGSLVAYFLVIFVYGINNHMSMYEMGINVLSFFCSTFILMSLVVFVRVVSVNCFVSNMVTVVFVIIAYLIFKKVLDRVLPKEYMLVDLLITHYNFNGTLWWFNRTVMVVAGITMIGLSFILFQKCFAGKEHKNEN